MIFNDLSQINKKYSVIYADPPWSFNSAKSGGTMKSGASQKYSVMTMADMKALPVADLAADDCALVMWYVSSQPQEALDLVKAWGFTVRNMNGFIWNKLTIKGLPFFGLGYYSRAGAECAIIATRGKPSNIVKNHSVRQVRSAKVGKHSAKPHEFYDDIDLMFGDGPKLELFARNTRDNWDSFGNEI